MSRLPYPADWKVVVVCNEVMWDGLMKQKRVEYLSDYAFTFQPKRVKFIRERSSLSALRNYRDRLHHLQNQTAD